MGSLSKESRAAKSKKRKERWEKGESNLQRATRFLFNKESYKETKAAWKKAREEKKNKNKSKLKMGSIERQNRATHGDKAIDHLKAKNKDFQSMKKGGMTKAQFIKKYPNSNLAKESRKGRR
tara:strand:- start:1634 stop:1999 length:366 start_codon:yes stop_codon:yes gene_type:complete